MYRGTEIKVKAKTFYLRSSLSEQQSDCETFDSEINRWLKENERYSVQEIHFAGIEHKVFCTIFYTISGE